MSALLNLLFEIVSFMQPSSYANLTTPPFFLIADIGQSDIEGGMVLLEHVYLNSLQTQYSNTIYIQVALLVVAIVLAMCYIFIMLLPFMQEASTETRRIAELLSQVRMLDQFEGVVNWVWAHCRYVAS